MFHVDSEVGRLRQVILHRPDLELKRLTPDNAASLLFDDVLWVAEAQAEHDEFAQALREQVWPLFGEKNLKPQIHARFPLADAAQAHRDLEGRHTAGKVLLTISQA